MKGKSNFSDIDEANSVLRKIMDAWNTQIASKYGVELDRMKILEKNQKPHHG